MTLSTQIEPGSLRPRALSIRARSQTIVYVGIWTALLIIGSVLRFWHLGVKPGWQSDEPVYTSIAGNLLRHGTLNEHLQAGLGWVPFLWHPPFYFLLLSGWFHLFGIGIPQARVLSVVSSLVMFCVLFRLVWKLYDAKLALATVGLLLFDGWLIFAQRVSYIENTLILIIVVTVLLYQRALERPTFVRFVVAGLALGAGVIFKHTGIYLIVGLALHWVIVRKEHRKHALMFAVAGVVMAAYVVWMITAFDFGHHDWYLTQSLIQLERSFGFRAGPGTLTSPLKAIQLLSRQYYIFLPSLMLALASTVLMIVRSVQCVRHRSIEPLRANTLLFAWAAGGILSFALLSLRFSQYFVLILVPTYCFGYVELFTFLRAHRTSRDGSRSFTRRLHSVRRSSSPLSHSVSGRRISVFLGPAIVVTIVAFGLWSTYLRVFSRTDNVLLQVKEYAATHIPKHATVITTESIGDEIAQPWCVETRAAACEYAATYIIVYTTYLQGNPKNDPAFYSTLQGLQRFATFRGFKETASVWGIRPAAK
jgi:hypothetical protein